MFRQNKTSVTQRLTLNDSECFQASLLTCCQTGLFRFFSFTKKSLHIKHQRGKKRTVKGRKPCADPTQLCPGKNVPEVNGFRVEALSPQLDRLTHSFGLSA